MIKLKPIIPKRRTGLDPRTQQRAIDAGMHDAANEAVQDFEATTATWQHQPTFTTKTQKDGVLIGTKDDVWGMLDHGTKPHDIRPRKASRLRFLSGFQPKTRPGFIGSQSGGSSGAPMFALVVHHPGTKPRGWSKLIAKKWRSRLAQMVQKRINEAMT